MSKELPYFKFFPAEWITGNITLCSIEAQGLFINLCSYYWVKDCSICLANAKQRFSGAENLFEQLINNKIIVINDDDKIIIKFLDEQMCEFVDIVAKRSRAGRLGGVAKAKHLPSKRVAKSIYKRRGEKKREEKKIEAYIPAFDLWLKYKKERKETYKSDMSTEEAYNHLLKLANNDAERAMIIVKQSIANNWAGLFALKEQSNPAEITRTKSMPIKILE
jgi:hypothetical protein